MALKGKIIPAIKTKVNGRDTYMLTPEGVEAFRRNRDAPRQELADALRIGDRKNVKRLADRYGIELISKKKPSKKEVAKARENELMYKAQQEAMQQVSREDTKAKKKAVTKAAKDIIKRNRTLMDRMNEVVKGKDGQPLQYNGEALTTEAMMDISLINQAKESPQANISLRAQVMALQLEEERQKEQKDRKAMLTCLAKQKEKRTSQMQQSLQDKGIFTDMTHTMLETWGNAWELMKIAEWNWKRRGGETIEVQITAQAQRIERPNQLYETYRNALKAYNDADQKLRAAVAAYFKLVNGDNDEGVSEGAKIGEEIMKIINTAP